MQLLNFKESCRKYSLLDPPQYNAAMLHSPRGVEEEVPALLLGRGGSNKLDCTVTEHHCSIILYV